MKQLIVFLIVLGCVFVWFGFDWASQQLEMRNPPPDQIAESADAPLEGDRSGRWPTVRKHFMEQHPVCEACGSDQDLNVHHIKPFHEYPELELEQLNLITQCREHHFLIGHDPDGPLGPRPPNWKESNPNVRADAKRIARSKRDVRYPVELAP